MKLQDFFPRILVSVDQLPAPTAIGYLRDAVRQFARDTGVWKKRLGTVDIVSPEANTDLVLNIPSLDHDDWVSGEDYEVSDGVSRSDVYYAANRDHTSSDTGADGPPGATDSTAWDVEQRFEVPDGGKIYEIADVKIDGSKVLSPYSYDRDESEFSIHPSSSDIVRNGVRRGGGAVISSGELSISATLQPTRTTLTVPDIFGDWGTAITSRALYEILNIPDKAWTDKDAAARFRTRYREQVGEAKGDVSRKGTTRPIRTRHRAFI